MTIREAINRCDALKPNQYPDDQKITWLSELDSRIYNDIFLTHEDNPYVLVAEVTKENEIHFPYTDDATMLLAEEPYDVLYVSYLMAKIDESNEETTRYANSSAEYNSHYQDFARFYNRAHMPITKVFGHRPIPPIPPFPRDIDEHPSPTSKNPVMSCGIWAALQEKADKTEIPTQIADLDEDANHQTITQGDRNAWNGKQDALSFDTTPTAGSNNPVTSGGVKTALGEKADASDVPKYLQDLANLLISNPQPNQVIKFINGLWQNADESGGGGTLPIASASTLGGVKVGTNLTIAADGTLSATGGGGSASLTSIYYDFVNDDSADGQGTIYVFNADSTRLYNIDIMWGDVNGIMSNYLPINTIDVTLPFADKATYAHFNAYNAIPKYSDRVLAVKNGVILAEYIFPANKLWDSTIYGNHLYSVGLLSDVHYQYETADEDWETACDYLDQRESVTAICIAGDLTSDGTQAHLNQWKSARNAHAHNKPVYSCSGNHESYGDNAYMVTNPSDMRQYLDSEWTNETENYFVKTIGGDIYIFLPIFEGAKASKINTMFSATVLSWLEETLETYRNQRVFLFSHVPPHQSYVPTGFWNGNGAYSLNLWGNGSTILADRTAFLALLAHYKNVIWFGGHSHIKYCFQETWTNLNMARYNTDGAQLVHVSSLTVPRDLIDGGVSGYLYAESEGAVMDVYPNHVIIRNRNFKDGKFIGVAQYIIDTTPVVIPPSTKTLVSISATKAITTYSVGDTLSTADITVTATYDDTTTATVVGTYDTSNVDMTTAGTYTIGVSYTEGGVTATTSVSITVSAAAKVLQSITATKTTTTYNVGDTLTTNDIAVTANYSDSTTADVTASATINTASVDMTTAGTYSIGVSYTEDGITETTSISITVSASHTKHVVGTLTYPSHTFTAASQTDANKVHLDISSAAGKTLYACATSLTYTGTDSEEEKVGLMMVLSKDTSHTAASYVAATAPDYKNYATEAEIVSKTSGNNFGTFVDETYHYILCQGKSSSSSTASFPVDFAITLEVYYYE